MSFPLSCAIFRFMWKRLAAIFIVFLVVALVGFGRNLWPQKQLPAALKIETTPSSTIFFGSQHIGQTPYFAKDLKPGSLVVKLATENLDWTTKVNLLPGVVTVIRRDFGASEASSSGETLSLEKGSGLVVITNPSQAEVSIDDQNKGETPLVLKDLTPGDHKVILDKVGYSSRTINLKTLAGYQLTVSAQLALSQALKVATSSATTSPQVVIKETGTGWLRVRANPSLGGQEIGKVNVGEKYSLLEENPSWVKIRLADGSQGWVAAQFVGKVTP